MAGGERTNSFEETYKLTCRVYIKDIRRNSLQCTSCVKWVPKRCSYVKGKLQTLSLTFICGRYIEQYTELEVMND